MILISRSADSQTFRQNTSKILRLGFGVVVCFVSLAPCLAERVQQSPEAVAVGAIAAWTQMCVEVSHGDVPGSWADYRAALKMSVDEILDTIKPTKRYAILLPPMRLSAPLQGDLIAVNRSGIMDIVTPPNFPGVGPVLKGPGRYVVFRDSAGEFKYQWVTEDYITSAFAAAKVTLPEPDSEPERPWVTKARQTLLKWRIGYGVIAVAAIMGVILWRRGGTHVVRAV